LTATTTPTSSHTTHLNNVNLFDHDANIQPDIVTDHHHQPNHQPDHNHNTHYQHDNHSHEHVATTTTSATTTQTATPFNGFLRCATDITVLEVADGWSCTAHVHLLNRVLENCFSKPFAIGCKEQRLQIETNCTDAVGYLNEAVKQFRGTASPVEDLKCALSHTYLFDAGSCSAGKLRIESTCGACGQGCAFLCSTLYGSLAYLYVCPL
jgi:hypothetical protein